MRRYEVDKNIKQEFYERLYVDKLIRLIEDEKDYIPAFLLCRQLIYHLPHEQKIWFYWSECCEKLGMIESARRCDIIGLHIHPDITAIEHLRQLIETYGPHNGQTETLRERQFSLNNLDFDLRMHYFTKLLTQYDKTKKSKYVTAAFKFMNEYLYEKHVKTIDLSKFDQQTQQHMLIHPQQLNEFRLIAEEFIKHDLSKMACDVLNLALKLAPYEASLYYTLYEQYNKLQRYIDAFKAYVHYMYVSGGNGSTTISPYSVEQYATCGTLLEKANKFFHALLAYYQCHLIEQQETQFQTQSENIVLTSWIKHIQDVVLVKLDEQEKNMKILLSKSQRELLDHLRAYKPLILSSSSDTGKGASDEK
jgi:tetratricopeptide (TPR) repeat protein